MAKFKIGQKVRVIKWVGMPQDMLDNWGTNEHVGQKGVIVKVGKSESGYQVYDIKIEDSKYPAFCFEKELEPIIKVGEQLLFDFIKE